MTTNEIPVSLEFFKKYTYHEECVDYLLQRKANGDQQLYARLQMNKKCQELALLAYYKAFYLKPQIRTQYHIRLKAAPQSIKDKLLSVPVQDAGVGKEVQTESQAITIAAGNESTASQSKTPAQRRVCLATQDVADVECVEDDDEPARSPIEVQKKENSLLLENQIEKMSTFTTTSSSNNNQEIPETFVMQQNGFEAKKTADTSGTEKQQGTAATCKQSVKTSASSNSNQEISETFVMQQKCFEAKQTADISDTEKQQGTTATYRQSVKEIIHKDKNQEAHSNEIVNAPVHTKSDETDPKNMQQTNNTAAVSTNASHESSSFNYTALIPYLHCCPLSFKEFCKYSNIKELVAEFCTNKNMDAHQQRIILHRSRLLFYLAPEHRTLPPINKIQVSDNCPLAIKEKFFNIPTNLYLKEESHTKAAKNLVETKKIDNINIETAQNTITAEAAKSANNTQQLVEAVNNESTKTAAQNTVSAAKVDTFNINTEIVHKTLPASTAAECNPLNTDAKNCLAVTSKKVETPEASTSSIPQKLSPALQTKATTNQETQHIIVPDATESNKNMISSSKEAIGTTKQKDSTATTAVIIKFPVTLNEFKKHTHYTELVEKLFKLKAQDNAELLLKYKNSKAAFDDTLLKYYRAFYLLPAIRDIQPIRFKPMPSFKRNLLLQIPEGVLMAPLNNETALQLILPDLKTTDVNMEESATSGAVKNVTKSAEETQTKTFEEPKIVQTSSSTEDVIMTAVKVETNTENSDANKCLKRSNKEIIETPSPKRQKTEQNPDDIKKSYRELLPYAHCCPVSYTDFIKYSNVQEFFTNYCQKRYNSVKHVPEMLKRAYILFYLAPAFRNMRPFNKIAVSEDCPVDIKEKFLDIPRNFIKEEKTDVSMPDNSKTDAESPQRAEDPEMEKLTNENNEQNLRQQPQKTTPQKPRIEILENRLLSPIQPPLVPQSNHQERSLCLNSCCLFNQITCSDIKQHTDIPSVQDELRDSTVIFKQLIYKIVNELSCNEKYMISSVLMSKILKHKVICDKCVTDAQTLLNSATPVARSSVAESDRTSNTSFETVIERYSANNIRSCTKGRESVADKDQIGQLATEMKTIDMWQNKKVFEKFCQKLLLKLQQSLDESIDFASETYKIFLECNEIPWNELLKNICAGNENNVQSILNNTELCEALQRFYYFKYMTNQQFALKYPVKVLREKNQKELAATENEADNTRRSSSSTDCSKLETSITIYNETEKAEAMTAAKPLGGNNSVLETAKRIFFRSVDKTYSLAYVLRTTFDYKQTILRQILHLTFDEFRQLTRVYEGNELYNDNYVVECMYRYVCRSPFVWPTNLFITLENLCSFLHQKNIHFNNYSTMLFYISPKILHWSDLLTCTNILDCVKSDYEKRTGKDLDTDNISGLKQECIEYYNRCWKQEKWLTDTPRLCEEFCEKIASNATADAVMTELPTAPSCSKETSEVAVTDSINCATNCASDTTVLSPGEMNRAASGEENDQDSNYVLLPSTQQQINMLPAEQSVSIDPLNNSNSTPSHLNASQSSLAQTKLDLVEELRPFIKLEAGDNKLLSNLVFYEDENGEMQFVECEEEIVELDTTEHSQLATANLPSSQIDFDVLHNSEDLKSLWAEQFPDTATSSTQLPTFQAGQMVQLYNVSLLSSGEKTQAGSDWEGLKPKQQETKVADKEMEESASSQSSYEHLPRQKQQRKPAAIKNTKNKKNIATVKPLPNLNLVPQIQHTIRPLQTVPAFPAANSNNEPAQSSKSPIVAAPALVLNLTPTTSSQGSTDSNFQLQLPNFGTNIFISQELQKNCSLFNNTSLLRIVDHNYHKESVENLSYTANEQPPLVQQTSEQEVATASHTLANQETEGNTKQTTSRITRSNSNCLANCSALNASNNSSEICNANNNQQQPGSRRIITRRISSLPKDANAKVNNLITLANPNTLVTTSITITIQQQQQQAEVLQQTEQTFQSAVVENAPQMLRKVFLHRSLLKFHYFKELTLQHMSTYLLPNLPVGKSYSEALIVCENFRTRISNRSISALFAYWPPSLQRDFLLVLDDLKEFHYNIYEKKSLQKHEDLRARVLFWLLETAPSFSLCQFAYEKNNCEFAHCEAIQSCNDPSYKRQPFKCLTNALSDKILKKLKQMKSKANGR